VWPSLKFFIILKQWCGDRLSFSEDTEEGHISANSCYFHMWRTDRRDSTTGESIRKGRPKDGEEEVRSWKKWGGERREGRRGRHDGGRK
jgi:acyl-ACP thioesterase